MGCLTEYREVSPRGVATGRVTGLVRCQDIVRFDQCFGPNAWWADCASPGQQEINSDDITCKQKLKTGLTGHGQPCRTGASALCLPITSDPIGPET